MPRSSCMIAIDRAKLEPIMRLRARGDRSPPNAVARSSSATSQSFSESSNVPSMSNSTPCSSPPIFIGLPSLGGLPGTQRVHIRNDRAQGFGQRGAAGLLVIGLEIGVDAVGDFGAGMPQPARDGHDGDTA